MRTVDVHICANPIVQGSKIMSFPHLLHPDSNYTPALFVAGQLTLAASKTDTNICCAAPTVYFYPISTTFRNAYLVTRVHNRPWHGTEPMVGSVLSETVEKFRDVLEIDAGNSNDKIIQSLHAVTRWRCMRCRDIGRWSLSTTMSIVKHERTGSTARQRYTGYGRRQRARWHAPTPRMYSKCTVRTTVTWTSKYAILAFDTTVRNGATRAIGSSTSLSGCNPEREPGR